MKRTLWIRLLDYLGLTNNWYRFLNRLGIRKDRLTCVRQANTWCWPPHLGKQTPGFCSQCAAPIFFEDKNWFFKNKVCHICSDPVVVFLRNEKSE